MHLAILAGSVLVGAAIFVNACLIAATAFSIDGRDAAITVMLYQLTAVMTTMIGFAAVLPLAAAGIGVLRTHVMPNWLGYLALAAAVVSFAGAFGVFATDGFVRGRRLPDDRHPVAAVRGLDRLRRRLHGPRASSGGDAPASPSYRRPELRAW